MDDLDALRQRLGAAVRTARELRSMGMKRTAADAGVSLASWRRLERGERVYGITLDAAGKIFGLRNGSMAHALTGTDEMAAFETELAKAAQRIPDTLTTNPVAVQAAFDAFARLSSQDQVLVRGLIDTFMNARAAGL